MSTSTKDKFRNELYEISDIILNKNTSLGQLRNALIDLKSLFFKVSEIDSNSSDYLLDIYNKTGKAVGPKWAELCIDDNVRTQQFIRGTHEAIQTQIGINKQKPVTLLYVGTGPFGTLIMPLLTHFKPTELQLILVEINPISVAALQNTIRNFGFEEYVKEIKSVDAAQMQLENAEEIDILLLECLQFALVKEQQVAITHHILPQLRKDVLLLPEEINLSLSLIDSKKKMAYLMSSEDGVLPDYCKKVNSIFELNKDNILSRNSGELVFPEITTFLREEDKSEYDSVAITTEIKVFGNHRLEIDQCSLTMCYKIDLMENVKSKKGLVTQYLVNETPGTKIEWI
jgi:predicted O-methyltransferase YrrM